VSGHWLVDSAGLRLAVGGPAALAGWWPQIAPRIPGACPRLETAPGRPPDVSLPGGVTPGDARRRVSAAVHAGHLRHGTLAVHGVAMVRHGTAVLLLGGHGAGKSLAGLALAERGWMPAAGDVCLIRVGRHGPAQVIGGTRAYIVRRRETARWFPGLPLPGGAPEADVAGCLGPWYQPDGDNGARLAAIVSVSAGAAPGGSRAAPLPAQAAASALCRASTYLIDKVLDDPAADPLRLAEDPGLCRQRVRLARQAAAAGAWHAAGDPCAIAAEAARLAGARGDEGGLR
jgi:hypothetical protein